jgi:hypothetical protein
MGRHPPAAGPYNEHRPLSCVRDKLQACATRIIAKGELLTSASERRGKGRAKLARKVRVRPSEPHGEDFDEVVETLNVCRTGIYFASSRASYKKELRLFVTYPYDTEHGAINQEYLGRVVRIDELPDGRRGIAVHLQMKLNLGAHDTVSPLH